MYTYTDKQGKNMKSLNYHQLSVLSQSAVDNALMDPQVSGSAIMYCGTLFVTCDAGQAAKIREQLIQDLGCSVKVSKVGPEFTFDFIA